MGLFDWFTKKSAPRHTATSAPAEAPAAPAGAQTVDVATAPAPADLSGTWTLDPSHSSLGFSARHAMVTNVRGQFDEFEGTGVVDAANPSASHATVVLKAASINTGVADRDAHLRSGDFFEVET